MATRLRLLAAINSHAPIFARPTAQSHQLIVKKATVSLHATSRKMSLDEWKTRAPYAIHKNDDEFNARYEGSCHCGRVQYQLNRDKPLNAKYCHCTTCQTLHGEPYQASKRGRASAYLLRRRAISMGSYLPQGRHQLHKRPSQSGLVRQQRKDDQAQAALQGGVLPLSEPDNGRGSEHDLTLP